MGIVKTPWTPERFRLKNLKRKQHYNTCKNKTIAREARALRRAYRGAFGTVKAKLYNDMIYGTSASFKEEIDDVGAN